MPTGRHWHGREVNYYLLVMMTPLSAAPARESCRPLWRMASTEVTLFQLQEGIGDVFRQMKLSSFSSTGRHALYIVSLLQWRPLSAAPDNLDAVHRDMKGT